MQRVSVVGNSGSGKSTLARSLAATLVSSYVELDAIQHLPGWQALDPEEFVAQATELAAGERWVIDGNYRLAVVEGPIWQRADTVVWLRLPRRTVMRQIVRRTLRRVLTRERLWNGNRESFRNLWHWNPEKNVILWAWTQHAKYEARYSTAQRDERFAHLRFIELRSRREAHAWLSSLSANREA